jgi:hypothetical protein
MAFGPFMVPQFIDVESKIFGPITVRQFILVMIAGMLDFIYYKLFYFNTFVVLGVITTSIFCIIAFLRINGMPFHIFFLNLVQTLIKPSFRIWRKEEITSLPMPEKAEIKKEFIPKPAIPSSRLASLSLTVNTGGAYKEED